MTRPHELRVEADRQRGVVTADGIDDLVTTDLC